MFDNAVSILIWLVVLFALFGRKAILVLVAGGVGVAILLWGNPKLWITAGFGVFGLIGIATVRANMETTSAILKRKRKTSRRPTYAEMRGTTAAEEAEYQRIKREFENSFRSISE